MTIIKRNLILYLFASRFNSQVASYKVMQSIKTRKKKKEEKIEFQVTRKRNVTIQFQIKV